MGTERTTITLTSLVSGHLLPRLRDRQGPFNEFIRAKFPQIPARPEVAASPWTHDDHFGIVGTAFDFLMGAVWAGQSLHHILDRAQKACFKRAPEAGWTFPLLGQILASGPVRLQPDGVRRRHRDYYRALVLLAELDAIYRSRQARTPKWISETANTFPSTLRPYLREHYPVAVVEELHQLLQRGRKDLKAFGQRHMVYNPPFGIAFPDVQIRADGDILLGDLLMEFKVSVHPCPKMDAFVQLLSYAAIDARLNPGRIQDVGIYNPRHAMLWVESLDNAARVLAFEHFIDFRRWFSGTLIRLYKKESAA